MIISTMIDDHAPGKRALWLNTMTPHDLHEVIGPKYASYENRNKQVSHLEAIGHDYRFSCVHSLAEAEDLLDHGDPIGAKRLAKLAEDIRGDVPEAAQIRRKMRWSDEGDEIDLQRVYSGQLDTAWRGTSRAVRVHHRVISIVTRWGDNSGGTMESLFWQGAAGAVLADVLERAGYRVELAAALSATQTARTGDVMTYVTVKAAEEPVNIDAIAAVLCHGGIFRTFGIMSLVNSPGALAYSFGRAKQNVKDDLFRAAKHQLLAEPDIIIGNVATEDSAVFAIRGAIAEIESRHGFGISEAWGA